MEITAPAGKEFEITIAGNPTTGYSWEIADAGGLSLVSSEYVPGRTDLCGSGGMFRFVMKADAPGTYTVLFAYRRPWEDAPAETREEVVTIT